jgi:hypothetical protein
MCDDFQCHEVRITFHENPLNVSCLFEGLQTWFSQLNYMEHDPSWDDDSRSASQE